MPFVDDPPVTPRVPRGLDLFEKEFQEATAYAQNHSAQDLPTWLGIHARELFSIGIIVAALIALVIVALNRKLLWRESITFLAWCLIGWKEGCASARRMRAAILAKVRISSIGKLQAKWGNRWPLNLKSPNCCGRSTWRVRTYKAFAKSLTRPRLIISWRWQWRRT
jgi:hypothetical protein